MQELLEFNRTSIFDGEKCTPELVSIFGDWYQGINDLHSNSCVLDSTVALHNFVKTRGQRGKILCTSIRLVPNLKNLMNRIKDNYRKFLELLQNYFPSRVSQSLRAFINVILVTL
ncbi:hypothetical protein PIB30_091817 [Stylosanthes scabra]|uniref:Uncharacterized protein n=1 Tax=Stylosanthes scabra TaxID=79078 RepID=A0ABU6QW14_9FABA|nr:hypothetical protein [Stylosanthes scabra]